MPYLNLDLSFPTHPKIRRLVGIVGQCAESCLIRLWCHCGLHHCETGILAGYSVSEIEGVSGWIGESGAFVAALIRVELMAIDGTDYKVHDWLDHQGHLAAFKAKGRAMAAARWSRPTTSKVPKQAVLEIQPEPKPQEPVNGLDLSIPQIPPVLKENADVMTWWGMWLKHLKAKRKSPSVHAQELQLHKLAQMGPARAIIAIKHSIEKNWQGLYEPTSFEHSPANERNRGIAGADDTGKAERILAARKAKASQAAPQ